MEQSTTAFELHREGLDVALALYKLRVELRSKGFKTAISSLADYGIVVATTITTKGVPGWIELPDVLMKYVCSTSTPPIFDTGRFRPVPSPIEPDTHGLAFGLTLPITNGQSSRDIIEMLDKFNNLSNVKAALFQQLVAKSENPSWMVGMQDAIDAVETFSIVKGERLDEFRKYLLIRLKDMLKPTYVTPAKYEPDQNRQMVEALTSIHTRLTNAHLKPIDSHTLSLIVVDCEKAIPCLVKG